MKPVINFNAVKATVDELFEIFESVDPKKEYLKHAEKAGIENPISEQSVRSNSEDESSLNMILERRKEEYFSKMKKSKRHAASSKSDIVYKKNEYRLLRDFLDTEVIKAEEYQTYFTEYQSDPDQRVYYYDLQNWIDFLQKIKRETESQSETEDDFPSKKTVQTKLDEPQLRKLFKELIAGKYISQKTKENDFVYFFSGKPLNGIRKIKWLKKKSDAMYLLDRISINLNLTTANNCIETDKKGLDSNNRSKVYNPIDEILNQL